MGDALRVFVVFVGIAVLGGCAEAAESLQMDDAVLEGGDLTPPPLDTLGMAGTGAPEPMGQEEPQQIPVDAGTGPAPDDSAPAADASEEPDAEEQTPASAPAPVDAGPPVDPFAPGDRTPDAANPPECPAMAPENPVGDCLGLPVYLQCNYTTYHCVCDWYHWLCI